MSAALFLAAITVVPAQASVFLFASNVLDGGASSPGVDLGNVHTFTVNGMSITAQAFSITGSTPNLYGKNGGSDETGLGLTLDGNHEISTNDFLQIDFADPAVNNPKRWNVTQVRIQFASVQTGESWKLWGSNVAGTVPGASGSTNLLDSTSLAAGALPEGLLVIPSFSSYRYFSVTAGGTGGHNVLLGQVEITTETPEPVTFVLIGGALLGLGLSSRKRRRA